MSSSSSSSSSSQDPHLWLEEVLGEKQLTWARERNAETVKAIGGNVTSLPSYQRILAILDSKEKIPSVQKIGPWYFNFCAS